MRLTILEQALGRAAGLSPHRQGPAAEACLFQGRNSPDSSKDIPQRALSLQTLGSELPASMLPCVTSLLARPADFRLTSTHHQVSLP